MGRVASDWRRLSGYGRMLNSKGQVGGGARAGGARTECDVVDGFREKEEEMSTKRVARREQAAKHYGRKR